VFHDDLYIDHVLDCEPADDAGNPLQDLQGQIRRHRQHHSRHAEPGWPPIGTQACECHTS